MKACRPCGVIFDDLCESCTGCRGDLEKIEDADLKDIGATLAANPGNLSRLLNRLMDEKEISREQLGKAAGISGSTVGQILRGAIECPPISRLEAFAKALKVSMKQIRDAAEKDGCKYGEGGLALACGVGLSKEDSRALGKQAAIDAGLSK